LLGMVIAAGTGFMSMFNASLIAAGFMIVTRCCTAEDARRSISWQVLIAIGASLGIGRALDVSGAADAISQSLIAMAGNKPWLTLAIIYLATMLFTEVLTNNAAAVLMFPLAMSSAESLGVSYLPFIIAIMIAASAGFATPLGYQTHLMVYGPGSYRYTDFIKIGLPLDILVGIVTVAIAPLLWPF